jgi:hypothetical protein
MIHMRALVAFDRNGKHVKVGDLFTAFPIEAASLRYTRKAEFFSGARPSPQSYATRHMTAQTPGAVSPPEAPREASTAPTQTAETESTQTTDGSRSQSRRAARSQSLSNRQMNTSGASEK